MTRRASPKLGGYAVLSALGLLAALVLGRPELVALTAPFLLTLAAGLVVSVPPRFGLELTADERVVEGDDVRVVVTVTAETPVEQLDLYLRLPDGLALKDGTSPVSIALRRGEQRELELTLSAKRWGAHTLGPLYVRTRDQLGLFVWEGAVLQTPVLRVYPREATLRRILQPRETQVFSGSEVARHKGEGIEFADVRPWAAGDALKRVNWRASARRSELWVNESHPERNTDVILFVDSFAEARHDGGGTLDLAVRATAALADAYVKRRDRVGLISFGGMLRWLQPGMGTVQLYKIIDALLDTEVILSYYWTEIEILPRRTLPPNALVIALSPLLDRRSVGALLDLRMRGFDLAVVDVSPLPFTPRPKGGLDAVAYDIWTLHREAVRHRLNRAGVAVAEWRDDIPLQAVLEEVRSFRRYARTARA
ncbi:MAG TPA: DUF58 domain-containing protein [Gaiellaceae bacterium]|nr:DUF58 domain-containing protein [Gaiellaceae bacterium]